MVRNSGVREQERQLIVREEENLNTYVHMPPFLIVDASQKLDYKAGWKIWKDRYRQQGTHSNLGLHANII